MKSAFVIAAPMSGSGKTTIARGVMSALVERGLAVQPFKCGPDYIDTKFHEAVCHRPSINLDTFMATPSQVRTLFARSAAAADVAVVEGMMGLFDGYQKDRGSTAEVAAALGLPVVLVVDARSAAYSMAPLLRGFVGFRPDVRVAGVIFNKVGSDRHAAMLHDVAADVGLPCFGCVRKQAALQTGERYLGLDFTNVAAEAGRMTEEVDIQALLSLAPSEPLPSATDAEPQAPGPAAARFLVARNAEAFSFIYAETLARLRLMGELSFFDPEDDDALPALLQASSVPTAIYLPGGYPEKHLDALVAAERTRRAIRDFAADGGRIVAECGGMMYLCRGILTDDALCPMCGVLPYTVSARTADRRLSLGYRRFHLCGREMRGHEFHYTQFAPGTEPASAAQVFTATGAPVATPVMRMANVIAGYTHLAPPTVAHLMSALLA